MRLKQSVRFGFIALLALALYGFPGSVFADGDEADPTEPEKPTTEEGRKLVKAKKFSAAIPVLEKAVSMDPRDASAWNFLAYSHRKLGRFKVALKYYVKALAINPDHKGANEYLGELYLQMGQLDLAKKHLAKLMMLCPSGCEELADLQEEIEAFEKHKRS
ncbi:MAG: tetratricopeptide repeat protein [Rhodospirillales bacterium]|jgi:tetratricopeptide (TPR) repeat protein